MAFSARLLLNSSSGCSRKRRQPCPKRQGIVTSLGQHAGKDRDALLFHLGEEAWRLAFAVEDDGKAA